MAHRDDAQHFLRFGLVSVFLIAMLTIIGMVALVMNSMPTSFPVTTGVQFAEAAEENAAGMARGSTTYYVGDLVLQGYTWPIRVDVKERVLDIWSPEGFQHQVGLKRSGKFTLQGTWVRQGEEIPVVINLEPRSEVAIFTFKHTEIQAGLRPAYR